jgi:HK97 family phage prohead protease
MPIKNDREYRFLSTFEVEERDGLNEAPSYKVRGYASTFEPYEMGEFDGVTYYEQIDRHAFDEADMTDVVFLRDHTGRVLARTKNNSVALKIDDHGLFTETDLGLTGASREMYEDIATGNYSQMSFSFVVESDHFDRPSRTRVIDKIKKLYDVSAVSFPANPGTEIGISFRDRINGEIEAEKAERLEREKEEQKRAEMKAKAKLKLKLEMEGVKHGHQ